MYLSQKLSLVVGVPLYRIDNVVTLLLGRVAPGGGRGGSRFHDAGRPRQRNRRVAEATAVGRRGDVAARGSDYVAGRRGDVLSRIVVASRSRRLRRGSRVDERGGRRCGPRLLLVSERRRAAADVLEEVRGDGGIDDLP